jgi:probable rRNA maturation factor
MADEAPPRGVVDLVLEDARWEIAGIAAIADRAVPAVLDAAGLDPAAHELSLLATDDARVAELNRAFRGIDAPTNVLSWPAFAAADPDAMRGALAGALVPPGEPVFLGDVALAYETCVREAAAEGKPLGDHAAHLIVHGVLHLVGHDHEEDAAAERMEALERKTLALLGVPDPYRD